MIDPRRHRHPPEITSPVRARRLRLEEEMLDAVARTQQTIMQIRQQRRLPQYFLTYPTELKTFSYYTQVLNEFNRHLVAYKTQHQRETVPPSYIRAINTFEIDFHIER